MSEENVNTETTSTTEANTTAPEVEGTKVGTTETAPTTEQNSTVEAKPEETKEPELTLESYGDLGLKETDDIKIDADLQKSFKELALKNKISPEAAKEIAAMQIAAKQKEVDAFKQMQAGWQKQAEEKYGDNLKNVETNVARVLTELDKSGEFAKLLELAGATKHPATLAFLQSVGDQILEKPSINANATVSAKTSLADYYRSNDEEQY